MSADRHERIGEVFLAARSVDPGRQSDFLRRELGSDGTALAEVQAMLAQEDQNSLLEHPLLDPAPDSTAPELAPSGETIPERIGPYRILGVLGWGSAGVVYLAEQAEPLPRVVALKLLRARMGEGLAARFTAERRVLALMAHPHIATILDAGETRDGRPYFTMEYVPGEPITALAPFLAPDDRFRLMAEVCRAVQHAHERGVVHRDLKPANILVVRAGTGARPVPKVIDFGVAKLLPGTHPPAHEPTQQGQVLGTLAYMSPEQREGSSGVVDARSDVYAIGVILREVAMTSCPGEGRRAKSGQEAEIARIVRGCTAEDAADRYASAADVAAELERCIAGDPVRGVRDGRVGRALWLAGRRRWRIPAGAVALAVLLVLAAGISGAAAFRASERRHTQERAQARSTILRMVAGLEPIADTAGLKSDALKAMLPGIETYRARFGPDPELDTHYADALQGLAKLDRARGDDATALKRRRHVLELRRALAKPPASGPAEQRALSIAVVELGDMYVLNDNAAAERLYREALAIDESRARSSPGAVELDDLCWSYERVGSRAMGRGAIDEGSNFAARRLEIAGQIVQMEPGNALRLYNLANAHQQFAKVRQRLSDPQGFRLHLKQCASLMDLAVESEPNHRIYRRSAVQAFANAADHLIDTDLAAAADLAAQAERLAGPLLRTEGGDIDALEAVSAMRHTRAQVFLRFARADDAADQCRLGLAFIDASPAHEPRAVLLTHSALLSTCAEALGMAGRPEPGWLRPELRCIDARLAAGEEPAAPRRAQPPPS